MTSFRNHIIPRCSASPARYYNYLYVLLSILFPTVVPVYCWGETWWNSFIISFITRTFVVLNIAWLVNSWAHLYGTHPFNK